MAFYGVFVCTFFLLAGPVHIKNARENGPHASRDFV